MIQTRNPICPPPAEMAETIAQLDLKTQAVQDMIATLVEHHISITSTPQVYKPMPGRPLQPGILQALSEPALLNFLLLRSQTERNAGSAAAQVAANVFRKEAEFGALASSTPGDYCWPVPILDKAVRLEGLGTCAIWNCWWMTGSLRRKRSRSPRSMARNGSGLPIRWGPYKSGKGPTSLW